MDLILDRNDPLPLWAQLKNNLKQWIEDGLQSGTLPPGASLPTEEELCVKYGLSRITVKRAYQELNQEGVVYRQKGRGTFIAARKLDHDLQELGFSAMMRRLGISPGSRVISANIVKADAPQASHLQVTLGTPLYRIVRVRLGNDEPIALSTSYLPVGFFENLIQEDLSGSLFELLSKRYHVKIRHIHQQIEPVRLTSSEAQILQVMDGSLALREESIVYQEGEIPIETNVTLSRSDRARYTIDQWIK